MLLQTNTNQNRAVSIASLGLASAVTVWIVWFITHVPWIGLPGSVSGVIVLIAWFSKAAWLLRGIESSRITIGAASGFVTSLVSLLLLGSKLGQGGNDLIPSAGLITLGFLAVGIVVGLSAGALAGRLPAPLHRSDSLSQLGWVTVAAAAPLLFIGGLVTSTRSGMAVPDWPTTFSANMFLYPLGSAPADIFLEHSHRLFGTLLGLSTLVLMIFTLRSAPGTNDAAPSDALRRAKVWSVIAFIAVVAQGVLGGMRVWRGSTDLAKDAKLFSFTHGVFAQLILAAIVVLAVYLWPVVRASSPDPSVPRARTLRAVSTAALHLTLLQLVLGAAYRHFGGNHALWTHAGFSILVVVAAAMTGFYASALPRPAVACAEGLVRALRTAGKWQVALVALQFLLGWAAFFVADADRSAAKPVEALIRTAHQANGAALLAVMVVVCVLAKRLCPKQPPVQTQSLPRPTM